MSRTCKRRLTYGITGHGWVWSCDWPGVRASHARNHDHDCERVMGVDESLPADDRNGQWREVKVSNCTHGCKIYANVTTGERLLHHNANYGCTITAVDLNNTRN